jgi:ketosteroid isomerase-like protein
MSDENVKVDVVRRVLDAWNRREPDSAQSLLAPDIELEPASPAVVERSVYRGYEEVASATSALWETWETFRFEESETRDLGDSLVWLGHVHVKGSASQAELDQEFGIQCVVAARQGRSSQGLSLLEGSAGSRGPAGVIKTDSLWTRAGAPASDKEQ